MKNFLITLLFGMFGVHKFMQGKIGMGILYLCTMGLFGIGWLIDCFTAFCSIGKSKPAAASVSDDSPSVIVRMDDRKRIVDDCTRLISTTTSSDVFFSRYELLLKTLSDMGEYVMLGRFNDYKHSNIDAFIVRSYNAALIKADSMKTDKGKRNQFAKAYDDIMKHRSEYSDQNLDLIQEKFIGKM